MQFLAKVLPKVRFVVSVLAVLAWIVGFLLGCTGHVVAGIWFLVIGLVVMQVSSMGRPVIINLFTEQEEVPEKGKHGYM